MFRRRLLLATLAGALMAVATPTWAYEFVAPADTNFSAAHKVLVTGKPVPVMLMCGLGISGGDQLMLLIQGQHPETITIITAFGEIRGGDKLVDIQLIAGNYCIGSDGRSYSLFAADVQHSSNQATVLFAVDPEVEVLADDRGVVTGSVAEDGSHKVVFVRKGGPNVSAWVTFNTETELGDSLTNIEPIYADENGTIFVATMEY
jgi:hypothetical protein